LTRKNRKGLVQVFTGDGKGKTTAALGTVLRAAGHGLKTFVVFFMKGDYAYGEYATLPGLPNVEMASFGLRRFVHQSDKVNPEEVKEAKAALAKSREVTLSGRYDIVVMDEVNTAVFFKLLDPEDIIQLIKDRPDNVELILTGRKADSRIIGMADLVTEMVKVKHPYDKGIKAREGIEY
jgi:cob(I)alamin adenosyltransferase